jgi:hypothetical protein
MLSRDFGPPLMTCRSVAGLSFGYLPGSAVFGSAFWPVAVTAGEWVRRGDGVNWLVSSGVAPGLGYACRWEAAPECRVPATRRRRLPPAAGARSRLICRRRPRIVRQDVPASHQRDRAGRRHNRVSRARPAAQTDGHYRRAEHSSQTPAAKRHSRLGPGTVLPHRHPGFMPISASRPAEGRIMTGLDRSARPCPSSAPRSR